MATSNYLQCTFDYIKCSKTLGKSTLLANQRVLKLRIEDLPLIRGNSSLAKVFFSTSSKNTTEKGPFLKG